jgi:regulator of replication initiation timing
VGDDVEDIRSRLAELSAEVDMLKLKYAICLEAVAKLRAELEGVKREVKRIRSFNAKTPKAYNEVEAGERELP